MFEEKEKEDETLDPEEPVLSTKRGSNSMPWHPSEMGAPYIYKVCMLGACGTGKSSVANRLVAHTFDPAYRATRRPSQLFWRTTEASTGHDIMVEIEDTPGVSGGTVESGELSDMGLYEVEQLLKPLVWFEKRRRDKDTKPGSNDINESDPLLPGGASGGGAKGGKRGAAAGAGDDSSGGGGGFMARASALGARAAAAAEAGFGSASGPRSNPIGEDRKRMGFVIVADVSNAASFTAAFAIVDRIFDRLQFDVSDPITCPVSVVVVGNKSDLRGSRREMDEYRALRQEVEGRYYNRHADPPHNVLYMECSAQTNAGLENVMLESLNRIRQLPSRFRIRSARMRATGYCAKCKKDMFALFPWCFEVEESLKFTMRRIIKPCVRKLGIYSIICECVPALKAWSWIKKKTALILSFRWLCSWCPPFVMRLRKEATTEEEDAADAEAAEEGKEKASQDEEEG